MPFLDDHPKQDLWEESSCYYGGSFEHEVSWPRDEIEAHVLQHWWKSVRKGRNQEIVKLVRFFARLERKLVLFSVGVVKNQAKALAEKQREWLHVGMEKFTVNTSFIYILALHKFVGWVRQGIPKVETVPAIRKIVMAVILAVRYPSI